MFFGGAGVLLGWMVALICGSLTLIVAYSFEHCGSWGAYLTRPNFLLVLGAILSIVSTTLVFRYIPVSLSWFGQFVVAIGCFIGCISIPIWQHPVRRRLQGVILRPISLAVRRMSYDSRISRVIYLYSFLIGGMLALFHPYQAFLFVAFSISALDLNAAVLTRTFLGPYLNLFDVLILVMLLALAVHLLEQRRPLFLPRSVIWIFIVWIMGTILGLWELGGRYEVIRASRWALNFPIAFLVAANLVSDVDRAERLILAVFFGALLASIQHVMGVRSDSSNTLLLRRMGLSFLRVSTFLLPQRKLDFSETGLIILD